MNTNRIKNVIVSLYKFITYILVWIIFMVVMQNVNYALLSPTRTAVITTTAFFLVLVMMQGVFGNFEIGYKKSKPVFLVTMIGLMIADFIAFVSMLIMGLVQFSIGDIIWKGLLFLLITYIIQGVLLWFMAHLGNALYFKMYDPSKTIIINNDTVLFNKINKYVSDHDKQYELTGVLNVEDFIKCNISDTFKEVETIFALGLEPETERSLIEYCYINNIKLIYSATTYSFQGHSNSYVIDDILLIEVHPKEMTIYQMFVKRLIDIVGSMVLLIITIPIILVTGIAIKLDDGGPVFYTQERLTKNGKVFKIVKFRSMKVNSGDRPAEKDDDRITKVGRVIRKLRIDELPQVVNILKGDISLVGPRPESLAHAETILEELPEFNLRLRVKGGLTGYAQIFGKYNTTPKMKLLLDLKYIESFSILEDLKLILQTLTVFVRTDSTEGFDTEE